MYEKILMMAALALADPATSQRLAPDDLTAMDLPAVVATMRDRCAAITTAMTELQRRNPAEVDSVPDCGGQAAAPDGEPYRSMADAALGDAILDLSADLEALVAHGEALQAAGAAVTPPADPPPPSH